MAISIQVPGATPVYVGTGTAFALEFLGYTVNGAEITAENIWEDVPGDQGGGEGGIPIDIQTFGQLHRIHLEFSKWDPAIFTKMGSSLNPLGLSGITAGKSPVPGTLVFSNNAGFRLLIKPPSVASLVRNYPLALLREPHVINVGTKWTRLITDWVAYPDLTQTPPLLWNTTT